MRKIIKFKKKKKVHTTPKVYTVRKVFANKRPRVGGRFTKITKNNAPQIIQDRENKEKQKIAASMKRRGQKKLRAQRKKDRQKQNKN